MAPPVRLVLDWDGSITITSTLPLIFQTGYDLNAPFAHPDNRPSWNSVSEAYMSDYRAHRSAYKPQAIERNSVEQELAWLESLRDVERRSTERAESAGVFCGVQEGDVQRAAEDAIKEGKVILRKGWDRLVNRVLPGNAEVGIVSVGWSGEFIRGCLRAAAREMNSKEEKGLGRGDIVGSIDIRANEIIGGRDGRMSRYFEESSRGGEGGIWTARDKRKVMEDLIRECRTGKEGILVYVGDSTTDLECLLSADVGVFIRSEGEMTGEQLDLERTLTRLGIDSRWIGQMRACDVEVEQSTNRTELTMNNLWWARNFDDICTSPLFDGCPYLPS
ncbi:MAG: hypothetical protein Q9211_004298 [Gyalolechia sp. 1 TL-2023]